MEEGLESDAEAGAKESTKEVASDNAVVHVRLTDGSTISLNVALSSTVISLKDLLVDPSNIPLDQQRLIYTGRILVNEKTLDSYGLQSHHTVHLVRGAPASTQATTSASSSSENPAGQTPIRWDQAEGQGTTNITEHREWPSNIALPPNPRNSTTGAGTQTDQADSAAPGARILLLDLNILAGLGLPELERMRDIVEPSNPTLTRQFVQNARIQAMVHRASFDPAYVNQLISMHPQLQEIANRNPNFREMLRRGFNLLRRMPGQDYSEAMFAVILVPSQYVHALSTMLGVPATTPPLP